MGREERAKGELYQVVFITHCKYTYRFAVGEGERNLKI